MLAAAVAWVGHSAKQPQQLQGLREGLADPQEIAELRALARIPGPLTGPRTAQSGEADQEALSEELWSLFNQRGWVVRKHRWLLSPGVPQFIVLLVMQYAIVLACLPALGILIFGMADTNATNLVVIGMCVCFALILFGLICLMAILRMAEPKRYHVHPEVQELL